MNDHELPAVVTLEQAADYLQIPLDDLRREFEKGVIPGRIIAGHWRIKREILLGLLEDPETAVPVETEKATREVVSDQAKHKSWEGEIDSGDVSALSQSEDTQSVFASTNEPEAEHNPNSPLLRTPTKGYEFARVFSYNHEQGYGSARLIDNTYVFLDSRNLVDSSYRPLPGDTVEIEVVRHKKRGLEGRSIQLVERRTRQPGSDSLLGSKRDELFNRVLEPASISRSKGTDRTSKVARSPVGTPSSQELYKKAALARVEGRIPDARKLFRDAIRAGGGIDVYTAFFKMEAEQRGSRREAQRIIREAIEEFPAHATFYEMYAQMERRARDYPSAEAIFRAGLDHAPGHVNLQWGLAQTLVQIGTDSSLKEAGEIFEILDRKGKLHKDDGVYQRYRALQRSPRANRAYDFFKNGGMKLGITGRRDLPPYITDIVAETNNQELNESFGLTGGFLVRCFHRDPTQIDIHNLSKFLEDIGPHHVVGLQDGREVLLNPTLAFIAVPRTEAVHDQVMSILSESSEAIVPLDDELLSSGDEPLQTLRDMLGRYLGSRDLYSSTMPVSGRRFFGRDNLLLQLMDELHRGQFIGIYGLRKMGKTSLIYQLRDEKLKGDAVAYCDLQSNAARTLGHCGPVYWELERRLYERLLERNPEAASHLRLGKIDRYTELQVTAGEAYIIFSEDIRALLDGVVSGSIAGIEHVVIVLDELERILPVGQQRGVDGYLELFGLFRGLAQTERYRSRLSSVVVAANASISERGYWDGQENPVFALYKPYFLKPLQSDECAEMISTLGKGMSVYWEPDALEEVFAETGGHPFLARLLCSRITKENGARPLTVNEVMVSEAIPGFVRDEGDKLEQITELLRRNFPQEDDLLTQIAVGKVPAELSDESLRHLLGYRLVSVEDSNYHIELNLLRRWLRRRAGIKE